MHTNVILYDNWAHGVCRQPAPSISNRLATHRHSRHFDSSQLHLAAEANAGIGKTQSMLEDKGISTPESSENRQVQDEKNQKKTAKYQ